MSYELNIPVTIREHIRNDWDDDVKDRFISEYGRRLGMVQTVATVDERTSCHRIRRKILLRVKYYESLKTESEGGN